LIIELPFRTVHQMEVRSIELRRFRGFEQLRVVPHGHVVIVGEPRAGRSTLLEGLFRVLSPDGARGTLGDDLDFYGRDRTQRTEVEVVLGELGDDFTQLFFDQLEYWNDESGALVDELDALGGDRGEFCPTVDHRRVVLSRQRTRVSQGTGDQPSVAGYRGRWRREAKSMYRPDSRTTRPSLPCPRSAQAGIRCSPESRTLPNATRGACESEC
jgi:hypothetical protein